MPSRRKLGAAEEPVRAFLLTQEQRPQWRLPESLVIQVNLRKDGEHGQIADLASGGSGCSLGNVCFPAGACSSRNPTNNGFPIVTALYCFPLLYPALYCGDLRRHARFATGSKSQTLRLSA